LTEIEALTRQFQAKPATSDSLAPLDHQDLLEAYAEHARSFVDTAALRPLRIVADTANGWAGWSCPS